MYVWDEYKNFDYCTVELNLQDNSGDACNEDDAEGLALSGQIATEPGDEFNDLDVMLSSSDVEMVNSTTTDNDGWYEFYGLNSNESYTVLPTKNDDFNNGLSTLDIVLLQRHILEMQYLDSPYKIIAADVDGSNSVTSLDVLYMRKMILGLMDGMPKEQQSWRFIDKRTSFPNEINPFPYEEGIVVDRLNRNLNSENLIAVKIGDLNYSAEVNGRLTNRVRSAGEFAMNRPELTDVEEGRISIPISSGTSDNLLGMQFTMDYDSKVLQYAGISAGAMIVDDNNVGTLYEEEGIITFSWNEVEGQGINEGEELFFLEFDVLQGHKNLDISLTSAITQTEAYNQGGDLMDLNLEVITNPVESFELLQNVPNPFSDVTSIQFRLAQDSEVTLELSDLSGKILKVIRGDYPRGLNTIKVGDDINQAGVMYYTLKAGNQIATKKMVKIR